MGHNLTLPSGEVKRTVMAPERVFVQYREGILGGLEIVRGTLHPGLDADAEPARGELDAWPGTRFVQRVGDGTEVMLVRRVAPRPRERWWLHALLFALTFASVTVCGAFVAGWSPAGRTLVLFGAALDLPARASTGDLLPGLWLSVPLCAILLAHELGHYVTARRHGLDVSPPYFIPVPWLVSLVGTFGAFIRLRTPLLNRVMLMDVGAGGPLAGMLLSVPVTVAGLMLSRPMHLLPPDPGLRYVVFYSGHPYFAVGGGLLFNALAAVLVAPHGAVHLHPLALAGWFGLFVTMLNLLPAGQLDGGHVLYALLGRRQVAVGTVAVAALLLLGRGWTGWWLWAGAILVLGRGRVSHPPVLDDAFRVRGWRAAAGWACVAAAVLTFIPRPF
ncbi:MAG: conserved rane protein of unknown function [Gemmatimonadetes bacterium]|nr:conserved rane protein of unknown function [Gemmatimonadota bacterium]